MILSGHRRWFAAKKLLLNQIPVYLVRAPASKEDELERLGSIQGGKSDWSTYEWAKYTYELWIFWEKCSFSELSRKMNKSNSFISARVRIFQYYPHHEIESKLAKGIYTISILYYLMNWLESLSRIKPGIIAQYKLELLRTTMLSKIEKGLVSILDINNDLYIKESSSDQMKSFITNLKRRCQTLF